MAGLVVISGQPSMGDRMPESYSSTFYSGQLTGSHSSARKIAPLVMEHLEPASVVDVGGGVGPWARVFLDHGVSRAVCVDGDYVDRSLLLIPESNFTVRDLTRPLALDEHFDLAVSLEVAEHLPPECGEQFVHDLVQLAPAVLFSAAIPHQGGVMHVNERWQTYWARLFERHAYTPIDLVRPHVWNDPEVMPWYAQNTFLYVNEELLRRLGGESCRSSPLMDVVAPRFYLYQRDFLLRTPELGDAARQLVSALRVWTRTRLQKASAARWLRQTG
jgi:hypothetical protein